MSDTETKISRSQMYKHQDIVNWLTEQGHITPKSTQAETIAAAFAHRNEYRRTDQYRSLVEGHAETKLAEQEAAKEANAAKRAAAKAAKEAEAAKAEKPAKGETKTAAKAPAKKAPARGAKAASKDESPFD